MESATCISFHVNCRFTHTIHPRSRLATFQSAERELSLMRLTIRLYLTVGEQVMEEETRYFCIGMQLTLVRDRVGSSRVG
jgi:hypothetical protein